MGHYASWTRIEPDQRSADPRPGARVPLGDPFWVLGRQWWIGELDGFDGGTPIASTVHLATTDVTTEDGGRHVVLSSALAAPEPQPDQRIAGDWRTAYRLGRSAVAHLTKVADRLNVRIDAGSADDDVTEEVAEALAVLVREFPLTVPTAIRPRIDVNECVDGAALLLAHRVGDHRLTRFTEHLEKWADHHSNVHFDPEPDPFTIETGRHKVTFPTAEGRVYSEISRGPALHWSEFAGDISEMTANQTQTPIPVQLTFEGAPPARWWAVEDSNVDFVAAPAGPSDLGQLLVSAALQEQGDIYWSLPLDVPGNSLLRVVAVEITDGFGISRTSTPLEDGALQGWKMGRTSKLTEPATDWMLILNEPEPLRGESVEEVSLSADETDNLIWLIEDVVTDQWGRGHRPPQPPYRPDPDQEVYVPRLAPPASWIAFQQTAPGRLERAVLAPLGQQVPPRTRFARDQLNMTPAMLGAGGLRLRRQWSLARSASGQRILWQSRRALADLPRGGSGLLHDQIVRPQA